MDSKDIVNELYKLTKEFNCENKIKYSKITNKIYLLIIELNPNFQDAYNDYAQNLRLILKDYKAAINIYTKLLEINPKYECAYIRRSFCKRALNDFQGQLNDFNNHLSNKKIVANDYISRSLIKENINDFKGVIADIQEALKLCNKNPIIFSSRTFERLGSAYLELKDYKNSFLAFDKSIEIELSNTEDENRNVPFPLLYRVYYNYITNLYNIGQNKKAIELLEQMNLRFSEKTYTKELNKKMKTNFNVKK